MASRICKKRLPNNLSIFSTEGHGILMELDMIHQSTGSQLLFLSDSPSCLQSLQNCGLLSSSMDVVFMWVSSYVGLAGNSVADITAKSALLLPGFDLTVPRSDYSSLIRAQELNSGQQI